MKNIYKTLTFTLLAALLTAKVAQGEELAVDSTKKEKKDTSIELDLKKYGKLKVSGYIQAQWQYAQEPYALAFGAGGQFPYNSNNRFAIRRGRIKLTYELGFAKFVIQPDFTEKSVKIKDVYIGLSSNNKLIGGQIGAFDRPFGYEISYSSSKRESPERSRIFLSLFPDERDIGAMLTMNYKGFSFNGGIFNGNGLKTEDNSFKDFIGRLEYNTEVGGAEIGAEFSYYHGYRENSTEAHYVFEKGVGFVGIENDQFDEYKRQYFGVGAKFLKSWCIGTTNIRAEYLWGRQPGTRLNNTSVMTGIYDELDTGEPLYLRNFLGGYVILAQTIAKSKHTVVLKYDYYDPNTQISGNEIGLLANTGFPDVAYSTYGVGYIFDWTKYLRLMAYYDIVDNERTVNLADFNQKVNENILTLRVQIKF